MNYSKYTAVKKGAVKEELEYRNHERICRENPLQNRLG
jgi:hypothetical protein